MKFIVYLGNSNYFPLFTGKQENSYLLKLDVIFSFLHLWEKNLTKSICMKSFVSFFKHFVEIDDSITCWNDIKLEHRMNIVNEIKRNIKPSNTITHYCNMKIYDHVIVSTNGQRYCESDYFDYRENVCKNCKEKNIKIIEKEKRKIFEKIKKRVLHSLMNPSDD